MTTYTYQFAVFIGRFQPYHNGHHFVIQQALKSAERVIVLCGSSFIPPSHRNPWSFQQRRAMITASFNKTDAERIQVLPVTDSPYNDIAWIQSVQTIVSGLVQALHNVPHRQPKIALIGLNKDHSSFYLKLFPQWESIAVKCHVILDATSIRKAYFDNEAGSQKGLAIIEQHCPSGTQVFLSGHYPNTEFDYICDENRFVTQYKEAWGNSPYPPMFVTTDAVVVQSGHVLLVRRRAKPGYGLMALPGGFVGQTEKILDACLRELREETRLKIPEPVLRGSIKASAVFDDPHRSVRGRTITHAFFFEIQSGEELPKVKGGDDASKAFWLPIAELQPEQMFEDHYFILHKLLGLGDTAIPTNKRLSAWQDYGV